MDFKKKKKKKKKKKMRNKRNVTAVKISHRMITNLNRVAIPIKLLHPIYIEWPYVNKILQFDSGCLH